MVDRLVARDADALRSLLGTSGKEEADRGNDELQHVKTVA